MSKEIFENSATNCELKLVTLNAESVLCVDDPQLADRFTPEEINSDNIRIYIPMDISADIISARLYEIYHTFGYPTEKNEFDYVYEIYKLVTQLEIYDEIMKQKGAPLDPKTRHTVKAMELAEEIIKKLDHEGGNAERFPYDQIEELKEKFGIDIETEI